MKHKTFSIKVDQHFFKEYKELNREDRKKFLKNCRKIMSDLLKNGVIHQKGTHQYSNQCKDCAFYGLDFSHSNFRCALNHEINNNFCIDWFYRPSLWEGGLKGNRLEYAQKRLEEYNTYETKCEEQCETYNKWTGLSGMYPTWHAVPKKEEYVYFIQPDNATDNICKIGYTKNIENRLKQLNTGSVIDNYVRLLLKPSEYVSFNARNLEALIHQLLEKHHINREFYDVPFEFLYDLIWGLDGEIDVVFIDEYFVVGTMADMIKNTGRDSFNIRDFIR